MAQDWPPLLTVKEAAQILRIGKNKTYELIHQNQIPYLRFGRAIRIPRDALLESLNEKGRQKEVSGA